MLSDLFIKNFAIIENLHVTFASGFSVLTGETGAGKSIIIDAVNLLLGGRARGDIIRSGEEETIVEAIFDLSGDSTLASGLDASGLVENAELIVRRTVSRSGKNRILINGSPVSLSQLRELTQGLVNIYGQHEHQTLQRSDLHLGLLDHFAGLQDDLRQYQTIYTHYIALQKKIQGLDLAERERRQRLDMLSFQQQELVNAKLRTGEDEELEQERSLLLHAEKLTSVSTGGYETLYAGPQAACDSISVLAGQLEALQHIDPQLGSWAEALRGHQYGLEDLATELRKYAEKLDFEPHRQQQVEERLALLSNLKRKYAPTLTALQGYLEQITRELGELEDIEGLREELTAELFTMKSLLYSAGQDLSLKRQKAAKKLSQRVEQELNDLAMPKAVFTLRLTGLPEPAITGLEEGEFYLAANPGEEAQALAKIASGGELSRIMLALKRSAPEGDNVRTLIFDEVDAGIGGEAASAVGEKISTLGRDFQVLCVTHLPQVAAFADHHYCVSKEGHRGRTTTRVSFLDEESRVTEMARMLGGSQVGQQALIHARELIAKSRASVAL